ncbi:MAG: DUF6263 family protein [Bacteroidota bacterium]
MIKKLFFVSVFIAMSALTVSAQKIAVKKGQKLETVTTTKMSMELMGQHLDNETTATGNVELKEVTDSGYLFSNTVKHMVIKGSGMGQDMHFDSDKKEDMDGQIGQAMKDQVDVEQVIKVDKQGNIAGTQAADDSKTGGMASMMNFTGNMIKGQPYFMLIHLPAKKIKSGESWTDSSGVDTTLKTVTTYTVKNMSADGIVVSFTGTLAKKGNISQNGMEIQMDMTGTTRGEATYEKDSGLLKTTTSTSEIKGTLGIMGQNAPVAATVTANIVARKI